MSTRCNIKISRGDESVTLYHHHDGMPDGVGVELERFLAQTANSQMTPNSVCKGLRYLYGDGYVLTDGIHGDINYLYTITIEPSLQEVSLRCDAVSVDWTSMSMFHANTTWVKKYERTFPFVDRSGDGGSYSKGRVGGTKAVFSVRFEVDLESSDVYAEFPDELSIDEDRLKRLLAKEYADQILRRVKIELLKK